MVHFLLLFQAAQATVVGVVRGGEARAPIAGAVVALPDLNRVTTTDPTGRYVLRNVPAGPQHIRVRFIGHAPHTLHALVPPEGQLEINVSLRAVPFRLPTLDVPSALVTIRGLDEGDSGAAFPDRSTSIAAVRNHPLLAEPDVFQALSAGEVVIQPESPSGVHIRGGATDQTAYLLDGIPVFNPYHAAGVFSAWNPDALAALQLQSTVPSPSHPNALSGTIAGVTRTPGSQITTQGALSTTQARLTLDGPLGIAGAGFLLSLRTGLPATFAPGDEASYIQGETSDWLAKVELPAFGGRFHVLGYGSDNETDAAAIADAELPAAPAPRNTFEWHSRSFGTEWTRSLASGSLRITGWSAETNAASTWSATSPRDLTSSRRDRGLQAVLEQRTARGSTIAGARFEWIATSYHVEAELDARTPVATASLDHSRALDRRLSMSVGASVSGAEGVLYPGPRAQLRWKGSERLDVSGSYARTHQFAQSLRNAESVVGTVFPADLYLGSGANGVPVARSDQVVLAAEYRPAAGLRLGVQAYTRAMNGLLLVAPVAEGAFATDAMTTGSGSAHGVSFDAAASTRRVGVVMSYGFQRVRLESDQSVYVPEHAALHRMEGGVILFPSATSSIRLGVTGALGRRATAIAGGFEWEACNLLDRGCEFGGTPQNDRAALGAAELPGYLRVDLGVRKHWHFAVGGRDALVGFFGTVTNLLNQKNVMTWARDPATGQPVAIEMRPLAPLVVGLDWRF